MPIQEPGTSLWYSASAAITGFMNFLPLLLGAIIVLVAGWFISGLLAKLVERMLYALHFEDAVETTGISDFIRRSGATWSTSRIVAELAKWFVRLIFIQAAAALLMMPQLTSIINSIVLFIPNIIVAVGIIVIGSLIAKFLSGVVRGSVAELGSGNPEILAAFTQYAVMAFAILAAIDQLGIAKTVIATLFIGLVSAIALAIGLAFGLGGREVASLLCRSWYESGRRMASGLRQHSSFEPYHSSEYAVDQNPMSTADTAAFYNRQREPLEEGAEPNWYKFTNRPLRIHGGDPLYQATQEDAQRIVKHWRATMPEQNMQDTSAEPQPKHSLYAPEPKTYTDDFGHRPKAQGYGPAPVERQAQPRKRWFWPFGS